MDDGSIEEFFKQILKLLAESERRINDNTKKTATFMYRRFKFALSSTDLIIGAGEIEGSIPSNAFLKFKEIKKDLDVICKAWEAKTAIHPDIETPDFTRYHAKICHTGKPGRPALEIDLAQIDLLRDYHFKWNQIAGILGMHRSTLWEKLKNSNYDTTQKYSDISTELLNKEIKKIKETHPMAGERMIVGFLRSKGFRIQRQRVRDSIHSVDPLNCLNRWFKNNSRWIYSVPGPNSLWHNDGLHKLIHWGMVIHACIDGYSRMITSLVCATNNYASTALEAFLRGVEVHGIPARVRGDHGGENNQIRAYMRETQGYPGAYIQGKSVHNQRIERLHYDTTHCVLSYYIDLFHFMENNAILDRNHEVGLFALQFVYLPRIQKSLDEFKEAWNHHQLSTEKNKSPYQVWLCGMMDSKKASQRGVRRFLSPVLEENEHFGIDPCPSLGIMPSDETIVEVNDIMNVNSIDSVYLKNILLNEFDPHHDDGNHGINLFCSVFEKVSELVNHE